EQGLATITSPVVSSTGTVQTLYTADGCEGSDTITATLDNGANALANIIVAPAELGELSFESATPTSISLRNLSNAALSNVSEVNFQLLDKTQNPIKGERILFSLDSVQGATDATLTNSFDTTDADGIARAFISGGAEKGTIRVRATVESDTSLTNQSGIITVTTGIATQRSLSLALDVFNPFSWGLVGVTVNASVRVSDFYNNPVANGTKVLFSTSHGQIQPECEIVDGGCAVLWTSQSPRPTATDLSITYGGDNPIEGDSITNAIDSLGLFLKDDDGLTVNDYIGKVAIMATLKGEETTLPDDNSNGLFDDEEGFLPLSEAYLDYFQNGQFDTGDYYVDWNDDGQFTQSPSTTFRGSRCTEAAKAEGHCSALADINDTIYLDMSATVVPSGILFFEGDPVTGQNINSISLGSNSGSGAFVTMVIQDFNGNSPGNGTSVAISATPVDENTEIQILSDGFTVTPLNRGPVVSGLSFRINETNQIDDGAFLGTIDVDVTNPDTTIASNSISLFLGNPSTGDSGDGTDTPQAAFRLEQVIDNGPWTFGQQAAGMAVDSRERVFLANGEVLWMIDDSNVSIYLGTNDGDFNFVDVDFDENGVMYLLDDQTSGQRILTSSAAGNFSIHREFDSVTFPNFMGVIDSNQILVTGREGLSMITESGTNLVHGSSVFNGSTDCATEDFAVQSNGSYSYQPGCNGSSVVIGNVADQFPARFELSNTFTNADCTTRDPSGGFFSVVEFNQDESLVHIDEDATETTGWSRLSSSPTLESAKAASDETFSFDYCAIAAAPSGKVFYQTFSQLWVFSPI
ncbi:MAG: hypothetical protein MI864_26600, partial [Pseudomonadales bacterium]|nr:hypothetical protein [Pseudomonadales bacterium]